MSRRGKAVGSRQRRAPLAYCPAKRRGREADCLLPIAYCPSPIADSRDQDKNKEGTNRSPRNRTRIRDKIESNLRKDRVVATSPSIDPRWLLSPSASKRDRTISRRTKRVRISDFSESPGPAGEGKRGLSSEP